MSSGYYWQPPGSEWGRRSDSNGKTSTWMLADWRSRELSSIGGALASSSWSPRLRAAQDSAQPSCGPTYYDRGRGSPCPPRSADGKPFAVGRLGTCLHQLERSAYAA